MFLLITLVLVQNSLSQINTHQNFTFFFDSFENLEYWESFQFSSGKKPTEFKIITEDEISCLQISSDSSASGIICKRKFNPNNYPLLKWKWKISNTIPNADGKTKEGDDYSLRIFVMFEKDSSQISFWEKIERSAVKLISGYEPPYKSLCYVWGNSEKRNSPYLSPYSDDVMIIPIQSGSKNCNHWIEESVNFVKDFKKYFEEEAPSIACIAISGDTDNTRSQSISYLESIEIK